MGEYLIRLLEDLSHRDNEIAILKDKVGLLEGEVSKLEAVIFEDDNRKYQDIVDNLEAQHRKGITIFYNHLRLKYSIKSSLKPESKISY